MSSPQHPLAATNPLPSSWTEAKLSLQTLSLFLVDLPQKVHFVSGIGVRKSKETLIVKWTDQDGNVGYGECACRPDPYYSAEFLASVVEMIRRFVVPQLQAEQTFGDLLRILGRIRGWPFGKAAVEAAAWDVIQQTAGVTLGQGMPVSPIDNVPTGISLGIFEDPGEMRDTVANALEEGYRRLKFKISPKVDTRVFDAVNPLLFDSDVITGFDANGSFRASDWEKLAYFVRTYHGLIEQPFAPGAFDQYLQAKVHLPDLRVCWDEEVKSLGDLVKLHQLGVADELNLKIGRVGGVTSAVGVIHYCHSQGIPCWIGGMFETGVGRKLNLDFAAFLPEAKAHDLSPSARYFPEDIVDPDIRMNQGLIELDSVAQVALVPERLERYATERVEFGV